MIILSAVSKTFNAGQPNHFAALQDVDLDLDGAGVVVFQGPSGSGKTTLLSLLGAMERPTSGRIWLNGTEITHLPERFLAAIRREQCGFVFQDLQLIDGFSALTNVLLPAIQTRRFNQDRKTRARELLEEFGIASKAGELVERLSGGERQRVALARALINDPATLIADEPTAHLDTTLSGRVLDLFDRISRQGRQVLIASHDPLVCEAPIVQRAITLRDGQVVHDEARASSPVVAPARCRSSAADTPGRSAISQAHRAPSRHADKHPEVVP